MDGVGIGQEQIAYGLRLGITSAAAELRSTAPQPRGRIRITFKQSSSSWNLIIRRDYCNQRATDWQASKPLSFAVLVVRGEKPSGEPCSFFSLILQNELFPCGQSIADASRRKARGMA
jgi:hypothetical protein